MSAGEDSPRGVFVTFEGEDGVGKTTQIELLRSWLEKRGREVLCLHEPGGTALGEEIRALLLTKGGAAEGAEMDARAELLLFEAARAQLVHEKIGPALGRGAVVLCDRFTDSTVAYQGYGRELGAGLVQRLNALATGGLEPDLTFLLAMDEETAEARVVERAAVAGEELDRMERAGVAFRQRVHRGFEALAAAHPERIHVIDAAQPIEAVHHDVTEGVDPFVISMEVDER